MDIQQLIESRMPDYKLMPEYRIIVTPCPLQYDMVEGWRVRLPIDKPTIPLAFWGMQNPEGSMNQGDLEYTGGFLGNNSFFYSKEPGVGYRQFVNPNVWGLFGQSISGVKIDYSDLCLPPGTYYWRTGKLDLGYFPEGAFLMLLLMEKTEDL
jgi:hypothetical protein